MILRREILAGLVATIMLTAGVQVLAQPPLPPPGAQAGQGTPVPPPGARALQDPGRGLQAALLRHLYPVEMVRRHAPELKLTEEQVEKLRKVVTDVGAEIEQLKWDLTEQARRLSDLVASGASKERVYEQLDVIFKFENKIKKKQLGLLIVVRDLLTPQQKKILDDIKKQHMGAPPFPEM